MKTWKQLCTNTQLFSRTISPSLLFPEARPRQIIVDDRVLCCFATMSSTIANVLFKNQHHEHGPYVPQMLYAQRTEPYHGDGGIVLSVWIRIRCICYIWLMAQIFKTKRKQAFRPPPTITPSKAMENVRNTNFWPHQLSCKSEQETALARAQETSGVSLPKEQ